MYLAVRYYNANNPRDGLTCTSQCSTIESSSILPLQVDELPATGVTSIVNKRRSQTLPEEESVPSFSDTGALETHRTRSGGFRTFLGRRRSLGQRERISRSRAQELSLRYELSDDKADTLNKNAQIVQSVQSVRQTKSLSSTCSSMLQALYHIGNSNSSNNRSTSKIEVDPLSTKDKKKVECCRKGASFQSKSLKIEIELDETSTELSHSDTPLSMDETVASTPNRLLC